MVCGTMTKNVSIFFWYFCWLCSNAQDHFQFLDFTKRQGNDLSTPRGSFPGLKPGDRWALCAGRWYEAFKAGFPPLIKLDATNAIAPEHMPDPNAKQIIMQYDDRKQEL